MPFEMSNWELVNGAGSMGREDSGDFVLIDFIPALLRDVIFFSSHEARRQITCEGQTFIENKTYAVLAVTWCGNDLTIKSKAGKEFSAVFELQDQVVVLGDFYIGQVFPFEIIGKGRNKIDLAFENDQFYAQPFQVLCDAGMIRVEMRDQQVFDLLDGNPLSFQPRHEFGERPGPPTVD
jgi:hypothetical protein